jgi:Glycosyltransferase Family 4
VPSDHRGSVVFVAFRYPPMLGPGSLRAASFARYLPEEGWSPYVVTVEHGLFHRDETHEAPPVPTLRTRSPEPSKLLNPLRRHPAAAAPGPETVPDPSLGRGLARVRRFVRDYVYVPDGQALWIPLARRAAQRALDQAPGPHVLLSSSVPYSSHLAALALAKRHRVPWVAEFRDPWSQVDDLIRPRSAARKRIDAALERRVVEAASVIVVTTDETRNAMAAAYPQLDPEAIRVVRNGFEPANLVGSPPAPDEPLRLVHAGSVPDDAPIEPLLRGIDRVARAHPGELELIVYGAPRRWSEAGAKLGGPDWLVIGGIVAPSVAQAAIASASANVLLRPGEHHRQYVAAKLLDYLGARRPILAAVSNAGEMAALGREYGDMRLIDLDAEDVVARAVRELLDQHRSGELVAPIAGLRPPDELTRRAQAAQLALALDAALCVGSRV